MKQLFKRGNEYVDANGKPASAEDVKAFEKHLEEAKDQYADKKPDNLAPTGNGQALKEAQDKLATLEQDKAGLETQLKEAQDKLATLEQDKAQKALTLESLIAVDGVSDKLAKRILEAHK